MAGLSLSGDDATLVGGLGSDTITGGATDQVIFGDEEQSDPAVAAAVTAGAGDSIDGLGGNDTLYGQGGDDTLSGSAGFNALFGGPGNDRLLDGGDAGSIETMAGGAGDDTLIGGAGTDYLFGDDVDFFGAPPSAVSGNDVLDGGDGADLLSGGPGNDSIDGGAGQDQIFGGAGDDILSPGTPDPIFSLFDSLQGGEGVDTLALPGRPEDYAFSAPGGPVDVVQSNPGVAPAGEVRATLTEIEAVAFGVSALDLANGAAPLTTVEYADLFFGSSNNGNGGRPHWSLSDSVAALLASNVVPIDIGTLLANDVDPDGGSLTLVDFFPTAPVGGPGMTFRVLLTASDIENAGYEPSFYPDGLLEIVVAQPVVAPVRFTYRTLAEEDGGAADLGSIATVTINPVVATADQLRATYGAETFIPYATLLANDGPGAVWGGLSNAFASDGSTIDDDPARGGVVIDSPGPFLGGNAFFDYSLAGVPGTATVSIEIDNGAPVAVPLARVVTPGTTFTITFDEIAGHDGHLDPNLDNLVFGAVTGSSGSGATFTVTTTGIDITFDATYSGGFSIGYTLADTPLGAVSAPSTISFLTAAPPRPVAVTDTLTWGIGDGVSLFAGSRPGYGVVWSRELLANDSFMPGTVRLWNAPFDLTPFDNSQVVRVLERGIPGIFGVTDPTDNGFGLEFRPGITSDTLVYTIIDPLGREAQGQITFNVSVPQPRLADNVIVIPVGATSVTLSAADILGNDTFTGAGAIAEVQGIGVGGIVDSGVDIGGGRTGIDRFTVDFNPPGLSPGQPLSVFTLNILTFDTAADGGSANGSQRVTFVRETAPPPPTTYSLSVPSTALAEGTAAGALFGFSITRTGTLDAATVTFRTLAGLTGDPAETDDFIAGDGFGTFTVTFAAGETAVPRALAFRADAIAEPNETFRIELLGATNTGQAIILDPAASVIEATILNDDAPPVFSIAAVNASVLEGSPPGAGGILEFVVTRTGDLSAPATVTWTTGPGAVNGAEAADVGGAFPVGSVTLAAGQAQATVSLALTPDDFDEQNETLAVTLTGTDIGTIGAQSSVTFTILDEPGDSIEEGRPPTPTFSLSLLENVATEGSTPGSGGTITLRIERTGSTAEAATVTYSIGAGTPAASADDLLGGFGAFTVDFADGQAFADIVLTAAPDTAIEPNEQIEVALVSTTLGAFDGTPVTATIFNDDTPPPAAADLSLSLTRAGPATPVKVGETTTFLLTVTNDGPDGGGGAVRITLPPGVTLDGVSLAGSAATPAFDATTGTWTLPALGAGDSATLAIEVLAGADAVGGSNPILAEIVSATAADPDSTPGNFNTEPTVEDDAALLGFAVIPREADLSLSFTRAGPASAVKVGENAFFLLNVANAGPDAGDGTVRLALPGGVTLVSAGLVGSDDPPVIDFDAKTWTLPSLASGATATLSVALRFDAEALGSVGLFAEIETAGATDPDSTPGNGVGGRPPEDDEASTAVNVIPLSADLSVAIARVGASDPIPAGGSATFRVTVTNDGPDRGAGTAAITLPSGATIASVASEGGAQAPVFSVDTTTGVGTWSFPELAPGATASVLVTADFPLPLAGNLVAEIVTTTVGDPDSTPGVSPSGIVEDDLATAAVTVRPVAADLSVALARTDGTRDIPSGGLATFLVTVTNSGPDSGGGQVSIGSLAGATAVDATATSGSFDAATGLWTFGALGAGLSTTLTVTLDFPTGYLGTDNIIAEVVAADLPDPDSTPGQSPGGDTQDDWAAAGVALVPSADLSLSASITDTTVLFGEERVLFFTVDNAGPVAGGGTVRLDNVPAFASGPPLLLGGGSFDATTGLWTLPEIAAGQSATLAVGVLFDEVGARTITAEIATATQPDPDSTPGNFATSPFEDDGLAIAFTMPTSWRVTRLADIVEGSNPAIGMAGNAFQIERFGTDLPQTDIVFTQRPGSGPNPVNGADIVGLDVPFTYTFQAGQALVLAAVNPVGDSVVEPNETIRLTLDSVGAGVIDPGFASAEALLLNDDAPPVFSLRPATGPDAQIIEGTASQFPLGVVIERTGSTAEAATVTYYVFPTTTADRAVAEDLVGGTRTYTVDFAPGQREATVLVYTVADIAPEGSETFRVGLSRTTVGTVSSAENIYTIQDDDLPLGQSFYFSASSPGRGRELWVFRTSEGGPTASDPIARPVVTTEWVPGPTASGAPRATAELVPGPGSSDPRDIHSMGETVIFRALDDQGNSRWLAHRNGQTVDIFGAGSSQDFDADFDAHLPLAERTLAVQSDDYLWLAGPSVLPGIDYGIDVLYGFNEANGGAPAAARALDLEGVGRRDLTALPGGVGYIASDGSGEEQVYIVLETWDASFISVATLITELSGWTLTGELAAFRARGPANPPPEPYFGVRGDVSVFFTGTGFDSFGTEQPDALWRVNVRGDESTWSPAGLGTGEPELVDVNRTAGGVPLAPEALTFAATGAGERIFFFGRAQDSNGDVAEALYAMAENATGTLSWQSALGLSLVDGFDITPWAGGVLFSGQRDPAGSGAATPFVATWTDTDGDNSFTLDLLTDGPFRAGTLAFPTAGVVEHLTADGQGRAAWVVDTGARDSLWVFDHTETYAVAELVGEIDELQLGGGLLVYRQDAFGAADFLRLFVHDIGSATSREILTDEPLGSATGYEPGQVVAAPGGPVTNGGPPTAPGARADLSVSLVLDTIEDSVPAGSDIDLLVRIANAGPDAASGTLRLTPGTGVSFTTTREGFDPATGLLTFGPIAPGDFFETAINTLFGQDGTPQITAEILTSTADDPDSTPGNGTANSEDDTTATGISVTEVLPSIRGTAGADTIAPASDGGSSPGVSGTPTAGRERIEAEGGDDLILASGGPDVTEGGAGNDTFAFTTQAAFTEPGRIIDGGADTDTLLFRSSVTLTDAAFAGVSGMEAIAARTSGPISLTFGAEAARAFAGGITIDLTGAGTPAPGLVVDGSALTAATPLRVLATDAQDTIRGGAGNDSFVGAGGADLLDGGAGDDTFAFVDITDILTGAGAWLVPGRRIEGGAGTDTLVFHENVVFRGASFAGVSGMEAIHLAGSRALIDFGAAAAAAFGPRITITAGPTTSTGITAVDLSPGSALDFFGGDTIDGVFGSNGNDLLLGRGGNDVMGGQRGQDTLEGGAGDDSLDLLLDATGSGRDRVRGDAGTDSLTLDMTEARLAIPEVQAELLRLKALLDALPPGSEGPSFVSDVLQLDMAGVETVHITLDRNEALTLDQATRPLGPAVVNDTLTLPENDAGTIARLVDVLANDDRGGSTRLSLQAVDTAGTPILAEIVLDAITGEPLISVRVDDPSNETTGVFAVTYTASNRFGTATGTLTITVTPENDAPVGVADRVGTTRNTAVTFDILANDIDVDDDALFAGGFTLPANGTLAINGGIVTYTPRAGFSGTDSFTYRPFDGALQGAPTTVTVTVSAPTGNRPPTDIALTNAAVLENLPAGTQIGLLSATDPDAGDTLSFSFAANGNPGGLFALDGNRLITAAPLDFETAPFHDLTVRVTDSAGNSYDETFRITVGDLAEGSAVQPAVINAPGFAISQQLGGRPPGSQPGGPALSTGVLGAVATTPITLPGESVPRARIENTGTWNDLKNLTLGADYWRPSLGTDLLVANFVDVRWDLSAAPPLDFDLQVVGAKRGGVDFGAGDDTLTWLFHSDGPSRVNTATVRAGAGNDTLTFSSVGSSALDEALLADNPGGSGNGPLWDPAYDGRFSTAIAFGGTGEDRIEAQGSVRLQADGGEGHDTLIGTLRNDTLIGGLGEDTLTGGGDGGSFRFSGNRAARRVVLSGGDLIDLRAPGGGGDGAADTVIYDVQGGGVDRVVGFEAGRDKISLLGGAGVTQLTEYRNGTFLSFSGRPLQGILIEGVTGLSLGGPAADIQLLA